MGINSQGKLMIAKVIGRPKKMDTKTKRRRTPQLMMTVGFLFFCGITFGIKATAQQSDNHPSEDRIALVIENRSSVIRKDESYLITVRLKNLSAGKLELTRMITIRIEMVGQTEEEKERLGPNFWSLLSLSEVIADSDIKQHGSLPQGQEISIQLDLAKLEWGHSISFAYPSKTIFPTIPPGRYDLYVDPVGKKGVRDMKMRSNVVSIRVDK